MERRTLNSIIETYGSLDREVNIAFGLRPSGKIHLGNMMSMALAAGLSRKIGPHISRLNVTVCDIDLPDSVDWDIIGTGYAKHFRDLPSSTSPGETMAQAARGTLEEFLGGLSESGPIRYEIKTLTEVQRDLRFREGLKKVLENPDAMKLIMPHVRPEGTVFVYPICKECGTSYTGTEKGKANAYENGVIHTFCTNPDCSVNDYSANVLDTSIDLAVHLFIDPLRDTVVEPFCDIHVFGGDYLKEHSTNRIPKVEKIEKIMEMASEGLRKPDILVGPTVYARDGKKMSKSSDNGLNIKQLKRYLGDNYADRISRFTMDVVGEGYNHIDYALVYQRLLKKTRER